MANDKYVKLIKQYSEDGGNTWYDSNPPEYKRGDLIETDSPDCGAAVLQYRWFAKGEDYYTCEGYNKYYKEWYQYSYDGTNWFDVEPEQTRTGSLIEQNSIDCDYGIEWIPVEDQYICKEYITDPIYQYNISPDEFICEGYDKYEKLIYQVSTDGGYTWENVEPEQTKQGNLIEENSEDCGYKVWKQVEGEWYCSERKKDIYLQVEKLQAYHKDGTPFEPAEYKRGDLLNEMFWSDNESCMNYTTIYGEPMSKGKVLYYDFVNDKLTIDIPLVNNKYIPIGIGIVSEENNLYGDGSISFMGLYGTNGGIWAQSFNITDILCPINDGVTMPIYSKLNDGENYQQQPVDIIDLYEYGEDTFEVNGITYTYDTVVEDKLIPRLDNYHFPLQIDHSVWELTENKYDTKTSYTNIIGATILPSMFNSDDSLNQNVDRNNNIFSKICGLEDTKKLYAAINDRGNKGSDLAVNTHNARIKGTKQGDWYIPSITEAMCIFNRLEDIKEIYYYLNDHYNISTNINFNSFVIKTCYYYGRGNLRANTLLENNVQKLYKKELCLVLNHLQGEMDFGIRPASSDPAASFPVSVILIRTNSDGTIIR